jgi:hypothetical protein
MIMTILLGMQFSTEGISISPYLPEDMTEIRLTGLHYHQSILDIHVRRVAKNKVDGIVEAACIPADSQGKTTLVMDLPEAS